MKEKQNRSLYSLLSIVVYLLRKLGTGIVVMAVAFAIGLWSSGPKIALSSEDREVQGVFPMPSVQIEHKEDNNYQKKTSPSIKRHKWQTYKNEKCGYEIKYPEGWEVVEAKPWVKTGWAGDVLFDNEMQKVTFLEKDYGSWQGEFQIAVISNPENVSLAQWIGKNEPTDISGGSLIQKISAVRLNGKPAKRLSIFGFDHEGINIVALYRGYIYSIDFTGNNPSDRELKRHKQIYAQILRSFRFIKVSAQKVKDSEDKVYTVGELSEIINKNPENPKNREIRLKAFVMEDMRARTSNPEITKCANYFILIDYDKDLVKKYDEAAYHEKQEMLKNIPVILSGEVPLSPRTTRIYPTQYGIYIGHFYDKKAMECKEGLKRFLITDKMEELPIQWYMTSKSETINSGAVIAYGRYIKPLYSVEMKNYQITINGVLYGLRTSPEFRNRWTDKQTVQYYDTLVNVLKQSKTVRFGRNFARFYLFQLSNRDIEQISKILRSTNPDSLKKAELAKALQESHLSDEEFRGFIENWER
ncbi:MAG: hypothetical protein QMD03_03810 [Syntrophales bacterium]|nr:hypothetical protein [Syntrophales bacterium]